MTYLKNVGLTFVAGLVLLLPHPAASGQEEKENAKGQVQSKKLPDVKTEKDAHDPAAVVEAVKIAEKRDAEVKQLIGQLLRTVDGLPKGAVDLKGEKIVWDELQKVPPLLLDENRFLVAQHPKYQAEYKLMLSAFDRAIEGALQHAKVCEADAEKQTDDMEREDYVKLALLNQRAAERLKQRQTGAKIANGEIDKLVRQAERDIKYLTRLQETIALVRLPLEKEQAADEFLQHVRRYFKNREELRKTLRDLSEKLEQPYSTPPPTPKEKVTRLSKPVDKVPPVPETKAAKPMLPGPGQVALVSEASELPRRGRVLHVIGTSSPRWRLVLINVGDGTLEQDLAIHNRDGGQLINVRASPLARGLSMAYCAPGIVSVGDVAVPVSRDAGTELLVSAN